MQFTNFLLDYKFLSKLGFFNSKCNSDRRYSQIPVILLLSLHPLMDKFNIATTVARKDAISLFTWANLVQKII